MARAVSSRAIMWASMAAIVAASLTVVVVARVSDDEPDYDGTVKLGEPGVYEEPSTASNPDLSGTPLPEATFTDAGGTTRTLDEFRGTPLVVNLWYKNCPPCARELGDFATVDAELRAAGTPVQFVGLNPQDSAETMVEFAAARGVEYELWRDTARTFGAAIEAVTYPVTLFVDADGKIVKQVGEIDADELRADIADLF